MNLQFWRTERLLMQKLAAATDHPELNQSLNNLLADLFTEFVSLKQRHWHVEGETFRNIHEFFDDNTDQILEMIDTVGEYVVSFGSLATATLSAIQSRSRIPASSSDERQPGALLQNGLDAMKYLKQNLSRLAKLADQVDEQGVTNSAQDMITKIDKMIYKYQAYLAKF